MNNNKKALRLVKVSIFLAGLVLATGSLYAAWSPPPSGTPPTCPSGSQGCDVPLHVGNTLQVKEGNLTLNLPSSGAPFATGLNIANGNLIVPLGQVGIGTASPGYKLNVFGTAGVLSYAGPAVSSLSALSQSYVSGSVTGASLNDNALTTGVSGIAQGDNTHMNGITGLTGMAESANTSGVRNIGSGVEGDAYQTGAGTLTNLSGITGWAQTNAGTVTTQTSIWGQTNARAGGTVNLNAGLYLDDQSGVANIATNNYQIYSAGVSPFVVRSDGQVGIGTAAGLTQKLTVNGNVNVPTGSCYMVNGACIATGGGDVTDVNGGTGISVTNPGGPVVTVAADTAYLQRRISGTCAAGSSIRAIDVTGTVVTCETDDVGTGTVTGVTATSPLVSSGGTAPNISLSTAGGSSGQVLTLSGLLVPTWTTPPGATNYWTLSGANLYNNSGTNVGIGTAAPAATLSVVGNALFGGNSAGTVGGIQITTGGASPISNRLTFGTDGTGWKFAIGKNQGGTVLDLLIIQDNGNVGIGTVAPNSALHVYKDSGNNAEIDLQSVLGAGNHWGMYADRATNQLRFWQGNDRLVLTNTGNVGIGTAAPGAKLDVRGDAWIQSGSGDLAERWLNIASGDYTVNAGIKFGGWYAPGGYNAMYSNIKFAGGFLRISNNQQDKLVIGGGDEWGQQNVSINPTGGNVGIGTVAPTYKLEVQGGPVYAPSGIHSGANLLNWPGYNGLAQAYGHYVWPGSNADGGGLGSWQQSYYLASSASWGLYTNTSMYAAGSFYAPDFYSLNAGVWMSQLCRVGAPANCPAGFFNDRGFVADTSLDTATLNGIYGVNNTGYSSGMLVFNENGSLGPFQLYTTYFGTLKFRNKTDGTTWTSWKNIFHDGGVAVTANYVPKVTGSQTLGNSQIFDNGTNVGIGTVAPNTKLEAIGDIRSTDTVATVRYINLHTQASLGTLNYTGGPGDEYRLFNTANGFMTLGTNNLERVRIDASGKVGIGITPSSAKLHVSAADGTYVFALTGTSRGMRVEANATSLVLRGVDNTLTTSYQPLTMGGSALIFETNGATEAMRIIASGNVGIGTAVPGYKVDVRGVTLASQLHFASSDVDSGGYLLSAGPSSFFTSGGTSFNGSAWIAKSTEASIIGSNVGVLSFYGNTGLMAGSSFTPTERMRLTSTGGLAFGSTYAPANNPGTNNVIIEGSVGIGTVAPGAKLEIAGQIKITGGAPGVGKVLTSDGVGLATWGTPSSGTVGGSGTLNYVPKWTPDGTTLGNSQIFDNGTNVGIGMTPGAPYKLDVNGSVEAAAFYYPSDLSLKKDIRTIPNALESVLKLRGVDFNWKNNGVASVGVIAQEVEQVYPELVATDPNTGLKSVQYGNLVGPLIESVKELKAENDALRARIEKLEARN